MLKGHSNKKERMTKRKCKQEGNIFLPKGWLSNKEFKEWLQFDKETRLMHCFVCKKFSPDKYPNPVKGCSSD